MGDFGMGLEIVNTKELSKRKLVVDIVNEIKVNSKFFEHISRLFADYKKNNETLLDEIFLQIDNIVKSPLLGFSTQKAETLANLIKDIYVQDKETFNDIRAEILENTVFFFGPFNKTIKRSKCYIEPIIKDKLESGIEKVIGETDIKCDFVFYYEESIPLEFVECKTDIANVIPRTLPFNKAKKEHREKITYLHKAYSYLSDNYCSPTIYFACYNLNYEVVLNNLQNNWGYPHMDFINAKEIISGKIRGA